MLKAVQAGQGKEKEGCIKSQESFMFFPELRHIIQNIRNSLHLKRNDKHWYTVKKL